MLVDLNNRENTGAGTSAASSGPSYINKIIANKKELKLWYAGRDDPEREGPRTGLYQVDRENPRRPGSWITQSRELHQCAVEAGQRQADASASTEKYIPEYT